MSLTEQERLQKFQETINNAMQEFGYELIVSTVSQRTMEARNQQGGHIVALQADFMVGVQPIANWKPVEALPPLEVVKKQVKEVIEERLAEGNGRRVDSLTEQGHA